MRKIDKYIESITRAANLACADEERLRAELEDHLYSAWESKTEYLSSGEEAADKVIEEFGNAFELGEMISVSKGRLRTYLKKNPIAAATAVAAIMIIALLLCVKSIHTDFAAVDRDNCSIMAS